MLSGGAEAALATSQCSGRGEATAVALPAAHWTVLIRHFERTGVIKSIVRVMHSGWSAKGVESVTFAGCCSFT